MTESQSIIGNESDTDVAESIFIDNARLIAEPIVERTFWDEEKRECNWMGRAELPEAATTVASGALVAGLYSGSAGVALFLTELHARSADPELLRIAAAALRRSFAYARTVVRPHISSLSFWSGDLGVAYAAIRLRELTDDPSLDDDIDLAIDRAAETLERRHPLDLMGGNAGAIMPLLYMSRHDRFARCRELALRCGAEIMDAAIWADGMCSWEAMRASGGDLQTPPWTGLSHGASGLACALLDVFDLTGDERYLATARAGLIYEDQLFSPFHGNWLDVRFPYAMQGEVMNGSYQTAWCHGAPGIALARFRAMSSDTELRDRYETSGRIAIGTTITAIENKLAGPQCDATLCHGIAGLVEVLLTSSLLLDDPVLRRNATQYAERLIERHAATGEWPSGITTMGSTPALMIGSAGVGYHFLRQHAPTDVPGLLLFGK